MTSTRRLFTRIALASLLIAAFAVGAVAGHVFSTGRATAASAMSLWDSFPPT